MTRLFFVNPLNYSFAFCVLFLERNMQDEHTQRLRKRESLMLHILHAKRNIICETERNGFLWSRLLGSEYTASQSSRRLWNENSSTNQLESQKRETETEEEKDKGT